jgi:hypothetical protein
MLMTARPTRTCAASSNTEHGPPDLKQFTPQLRQVIWPRNFKLEKLKKYDDKEKPESWVTLYEITVCPLQVMST